MLLHRHFHGGFCHKAAAGWSDRCYGGFSYNAAAIQKEYTLVSHFRGSFPLTLWYSQLICRWLTPMLHSNTIMLLLIAIRTVKLILEKIKVINRLLSGKALSYASERCTGQRGVTLNSVQDSVDSSSALSGTAFQSRLSVIWGQR